MRQEWSSDADGQVATRTTRMRRGSVEATMVAAAFACGGAVAVLGSGVWRSPVSGTDSRNEAAATPPSTVSDEGAS